MNVGRHPQHYLPPNHHQPIQDMLCPNEEYLQNLDHPYEPTLSNGQTNIISQRIPQVDGGVDSDDFQCPKCKKVLETNDDMKWHYETQIGRQDCSILRSMLGWNPT